MPSKLELALRREAAKDDIGKLVYADWLEEQGDLRGELIRINVELEKMKFEVGLIPCSKCNPEGKASALICPTNCDECAEHSGWKEKTSPERRKHFNDLVERRVEILYSLPARWYEITIYVSSLGWENPAKNYSLGKRMCLLSTSEVEAQRTALQFDSDNCLSSQKYFSYRPQLQAFANLMQTVVPYEE